MPSTHSPRPQPPPNTQPKPESKPESKRRSDPAPQRPSVVLLSRGERRAMGLRPGRGGRFVRVRGRVVVEGWWNGPTSGRTAGWKM